MHNNTIALVQYKNTIPYLCAMDKLSAILKFDVIQDTPAQCAEHFKAGRTSIALVPSGCLRELPDHIQFSSYGIGCHGAVNTVALLSQVPLDQINTIYLDPHSRTSNLLAQILCTEHWNIHPEYLLLDQGYDQESIIAIGDKVFNLESQYSYKYDLGEAWLALTGLPFVFAVWVAQPNIDKQHLAAIEAAFVESMQNKEVWYEHIEDNHIPRLKHYLEKEIKFHIDQDMESGLLLYQQYITKLHQYESRSIRS